MNKSDLLGRWKIVSWVQLYDDGRSTYPFGEQLRGFIQYDSDRMFCLLEKVGRQPFTTGGQWDASIAEKAAAYDTLMCYAGGYRLDGDKVIHEVEISLCPNWENGEQARRVVFESDRLHLTARLEEHTTQARTAQLTWERY
ncbi:lipocalin-like domain-containing protein [Paraburkholderia caribensis]|uniref:lipocalin-like domain-containing protein n=1 Tax=Paraburkholderia caribensis TaxID=75105 RepID=UPI001CAE12CE|nr:lipocalin-like domain-containing protein [Paraburkholderia caribensis]CAG9263071.1 Lipocalin-like domain-containing protein [Paraburkholderia caribensis]